MYPSYVCRFKTLFAFPERSADAGKDGSKQREHGVTLDSDGVFVPHNRRARRPSPSWRTFLRLHARHIWAVDFFTVQTLTFRSLYVFVVVNHERRRIEHWNVTEHPNASWVWRQFIAATPWGHQPRFLIRDRDARFGADFNRRLRRLGTVPIVTPFRAPKANAIVERTIGTIRRECLDHVLVFGENHLRHVLREYVAYYNATRPHQSLEAQPPSGPRPLAPSTWVSCRPTYPRGFASRVSTGGCLIRF